MRRLPVAFAVAGALLAVPASASAQGATVQAVDAGNVWSPSGVTITAGDTVTWNFAGTAVPHNVASNSDNWDFTSPFHTGQGTESFTFATPGTYLFVCTVHPTTMTGSVAVTDESGNPPPPPPTPPPGKEPLPNETGPFDDFESGGLDRTRPELRRVRIQGVRGGARVRFRASERALVKVRVKLFGITLKTKRVRVDRGRERVTVRGFRPRRYQVVVRAVDPAGNHSRRHAERVRAR